MTDRTGALLMALLGAIVLVALVTCAVFASRARALLRRPCLAEAT